MTCVLDLQVCLDNQRLIGGIATKRNSHARGKQLLHRYIQVCFNRSYPSKECQSNADSVVVGRRLY